MRSLICPVSPEKVNENVVRITGFLTALMLAAYITTGNIFLVWLTLFDFCIRAFTSIKYSALSGLGSILARSFNLKEIKIPKAPKIFAARVGVLFLLAIGFLYYINEQTGSEAVALVLIGFALPIAS